VLLEIGWRADHVAEVFSTLLSVTDRSRGILKHTAVHP
jgi:hypothetical protein